MIGLKTKYLLQGGLKFLSRNSQNLSSAKISFLIQNPSAIPSFLSLNNHFFRTQAYTFSTSTPSVAQLQKEAENTKKQKGENSMQYLQKLHELSFAQAKNNNIQKAIDIYRNIVKTFEQNIDDKMSPALGDSIENLQMLYKSSGNLMEFIPLTLKLLQIRIKQLGEEHQKIATLINQLGVAYYHIENFQESLERYNSAIKIREKLFGKDSLKVIEVLNNLATTLVAKGENQKAKSIIQQNIQKIKALPDFNQKLLITPIANLAAILEKSRKYKEALESFSECVQIIKKVSKKSSYYLANIYHSMGIVCMKMNNIKKAEEYHNESLKINKQLYGEKHPAVAQNMHNLGVCYEAYGQYERSLESYKKSNDIKGNVLGQDHPLLAETYNNMGIVCKMMGKLDESLNAFESGLEILKKQNPAEDTSPIYADLHLNIASIHMEQQQPEKAIEHFRRSKELYLIFFDQNHIKLAEVYFGLGQYSFMKNNISQAKDHISKCISSYEQNSPTNPHLYVKYSLKGSCFEREKQYQQAIQCFLKSIQCLETKYAAFPPQLVHINTASLNYQIGDSYFAFNEKSKAKEHYLTAVKIFEQHFAEAYDTLVVVYERIAQVEREMNNKQKAKEYYMKADNALTELLKQNNNHPELVKKQQSTRKFIEECTK